MSLLTALLFPALLYLGFWQLDRAEEKSAIAAQNLERSAAPAISLSTAISLPVDQVAFRQIQLSGQFEPDVLVFLDNQIRDGRYGHDVFGLFRDDGSDMLVLVNRGWVQGDPSRRSLPEIETPSGQLSLMASAYLPPGEPYLLAEDTFTDLKWPLLVQTANTAALWAAFEDSLSRPVYPVELRLLPDSTAGFRRDWAVVNVSPQKHKGYAVQWFTMAAALLVLYIVRSSNLRDILFKRASVEQASASGRQEKD